MYILSNYVLCFQSGKKAMDEHLTMCHMYQIAQDRLKTCDKVGELTQENRALCSEVCALTTRVGELIDSNRVRDAEIKELKALINSLLLSHSEIRCSADVVELDSVAEKPEVRKSSQAKGIKKSVDSSSETDNRATLISSEELVSRLQRMSESIVEVQATVAGYGTLLEDMRLRQDILDVKTTNGTMIWKIPDLRRRYRDAVERKTISLYSPPFYTGPHSYKVCIRLYLNGDGIGKGTHVSLFFFLMCSEHDNLLTWPFKQSVRFTILHQKDSSKSITEAFVPDPKSDSFKKPQKDMNVASGFPKFARQSVLQDEGFNRDNVLFIKCQVDLSGLFQV